MIDGWSEGVFLGTPGYNGDPLIMLNGSGAGGTANGLTISNAPSTGSEIRGLIISNFGQDGIQITAGANNVWVHGNWIGLDATGAAAGNLNDGIDISATGTTIGGAAAADRNVISDNTRFGIVTSGAGTVIQGNYIGTNATGTAQLQNLDDGIRISSNSNTVTGNVIGFNGHDGLEIAGGDSNVVQGNYIGTDPTGTINLAVGSGALDDAIDISGDADLNTIGGTAVGEGNVLANAFGAGVRSDRPADDTADQNRIRGNSIYNNGDGGILLYGFVQEASGAFDPDTGANQGQNYPSFAGATVSFVGGNLQIDNITLSTTANSTYAIDFYANPAGAAGLLLQGKRYLGSTTVSTGAAGTVTFNATLAGPGLLAGERITATATTTASGTATEVGNTSPFSTTFVTTPNTAPVNTVPGARSVNEDTALAIAGSERQRRERQPRHHPPHRAQRRAHGEPGRRGYDQLGGQRLGDPHALRDASANQRRARHDQLPGQLELQRRRHPHGALDRHRRRHRLRYGGDHRQRHQRCAGDHLQWRRGHGQRLGRREPDRGHHRHRHRPGRRGEPHLLDHRRGRSGALLDQRRHRRAHLHRRPQL